MLDEFRTKIDAIDTEILILLNQRAAIARRIGAVKMRAGLPIVDRQREDEILRRIARENEGSLDDDAAVRIYAEILRESRKLQIDLADSVEQSGQVQ